MLLVLSLLALPVASQSGGLERQSTPSPCLGGDRPGIRSLGLATPGTGGLPALELSGGPAVGLSFSLVVRGPANTAGVLYWSPTAAPTPLPAHGAILYPATPFSMVEPFVTDASGVAAGLARIPLVTYDLCGTTAVAQAVLSDPLAQGGMSYTKAAQILFGGLPSSTIYGAGSHYEAAVFVLDVALGDVTGDQLPDLVHTIRQSNLAGDVGVRAGDGQGGFGALVTLPAYSQWLERVLVADLNGDVVEDIVAVSPLGSNGGRVAVLLGLGGGAFAGSVLFKAGPGPFDVDATDLDGDGDLDLVVANGFGNTSFPEGGVSLLFNDGAGSFANPFTYTAGVAPVDVVTGDLNGDGRPDVVAASVTSLANGYEAQISVRLGVNGGFLGPFLGTLTNYPVSTVANTVALCPVLADFDRDGALDVAVLWTSDTVAAHGVAILLGAGDGTFAPPLQHPSSASPRALATADVDGDERFDLVLAEYAPTNVRTLFGNGDGTFVDGPALSFPRFRTGLALGDVDGDLLPDLATAAASGNRVTVHPNRLFR